MAELETYKKLTDDKLSFRSYGAYIIQILIP